MTHIYRVTCRFSGEWLEWESIEPGCRTVSASHPHLVRKPMLQSERKAFAEMVNDGRTSWVPVGQKLYEIFDK